MATVISNPTRVGAKTWKYEWTGTAPFRIFSYDTYSYIHRDFPDTQLTIYGTSNLTPPVLEIFDSTEGDPAKGDTYPAQVVVQWRGTSTAKEYVVYDTDNAATLATIPETGKGYYIWAGNTILADADTVNYTVNVKDVAGNASEASNQTFVVNRNPDAVKLSIAYDSGTNTFTVTEGSD